MRNIMMYGLALLWAAPVLAQEAKSSFTDFTDWPRLEHAHVALPDLVKDTALLRRYAADLYTYLAQ